MITLEQYHAGHTERSTTGYTYFVPAKIAETGFLYFSNTSTSFKPNAAIYFTQYKIYHPLRGFAVQVNTYSFSLNIPDGNLYAGKYVIGCAAGNSGRFVGNKYSGG